MACATLRKESLCSVRLLEAYPLSPFCRDIFSLASERLKRVGNGRLTTSFLLLAMLELNPAARRTGPLRVLYEATERTDAEELRRVREAYISWYQRSCMRSSGGQRDNVEADSMTPYVPRVLNLALCRARAEAQDLIGVGHLLGALLTFDPGCGAVQPGIQCILSLLRARFEPAHSRVSAPYARRRAARHLAIASGPSRRWRG